jgi:hypothetical protein
VHSEAERPNTDDRKVEGARDRETSKAIRFSARGATWLAVYTAFGWCMGAEGPPHQV